MNDEEHADNHKTGGVHQTGELLYSLREKVSEHKDEAAGRDGENGRNHGPGKKLLADIKLTDPDVSQGDIVDPQAFDPFKESGRAPAAFGPYRPTPDMSKLDHDKGDGHYYEEQRGDPMNGACYLQTDSQMLIGGKAWRGQVRKDTSQEIIGDSE